ncbi:diguanylate cyclase (GGDEF) domain-containing protein [Chitinivibrio alkaliphilus ACht1]|uniref:diguanylate cyclase n=2 Tax=Chitinivibrio TaxID=1505231 RepID=U7D520_9BACT|nr:diguanylate cyclase (GGDEF) domain-containing protein [Chitinivibrio alkaliphilus ACht1]
MLILNDAQKSYDRYAQYARENKKEELREVYQNIISQHNVGELLDYSMQEIRRLGSKNATIVLFYNYASIPYLDWNMPEVSFVKRQISKGKEVALPQDGLVINSHDILPTYTHSFNKMIFLPLYFYGEYFGYIITDIITDTANTMYEDLRSHVSTALHNCYMKERFSALSMQDELTDVSNKNGFMLLSQQMISQAISTETPLGIYYFDIENLQSINEKYGQEMGDRAIVAAASLIARTFRTTDIIGRIDGGGFAVTIKVRDTKMVEELSKRLFENLERYNSHSGLPLSLSLRSGYTHFIATTETTIEEELSVVIEKAMIPQRSSS